MLMGAAMGKKYPARKYANVVMIVLGVALFMGAGTGGDKKKAVTSSDGADNGGGSIDGSDSDNNDSNASPSQIVGIVLLFVSLCFDGGTGAYEDKLMSVHSVQPFDLMYNIQLGKTILAFIGLLVLNQLHIFIQMVQEMGFLLVALGFSGALGQVFIFVTIAKFGALTCSIIGLSRKVTTLVASIYFYGHHLNSLQFTGLMISITAMVMNFWGKKGGGGGGHGHQNESGTSTPKTANMPEEMQKMLDDEPNDDDDDDDDDDDSGGDVELAFACSPKELV
jgi:UDP-galactose transporter B1